MIVVVDDDPAGPHRAEPPADALDFPVAVPADLRCCRRPRRRSCSAAATPRTGDDRPGERIASGVLTGVRAGMI